MKLFKSKADKKRDAFVRQALEYGSDPKRRDTLIIMGDPETDVLVAMCKGTYTAIHRKRSIAVVRNLVELNKDTRDGALLNQFVQDIAYMVVGIGDQLVNERAMRRGLAKAKDNAAKNGQPMAVFGVNDDKGNTKEMIAVK